MSLVRLVQSPCLYFALYCIYISEQLNDDDDEANVHCLSRAVQQLVAWLTTESVNDDDALFAIC